MTGSMHSVSHAAMGAQLAPARPTQTAASALAALEGPLHVYYRHARALPATGTIVQIRYIFLVYIINNFTLQTECQPCAVGTRCSVCTSGAPDACILCASCGDNQVSARIPPYCACPPNFFDNYPTQIDCQLCVSTVCATCNNTQTCSTCATSTQSRIGSNCSCPSGFGDDGLNAQCFSCNNPRCYSCKDFSLNCVSCVGTLNANQSRLLP